MKQLFTFFCLLVLISVFSNAYACTNFIISKGASEDGSVMVSYAADSHVLFGELYHYEAKEYPEGTMRKIYEWDTGEYKGEIPEARQTYNVVGNMNEYQLIIAETTYGGREELYTQAGAIMDYGSLIYVALQRCKTAREAIKLIGELMEAYGYASEGEDFSIADKNEAWIMEIIGKGEGKKGAVWVARLIPDGYICAHANHPRITQFPQNCPNSITSKELDKIFDPEVNCVYAYDTIDFAREKGYYTGEDKDFSFSDTYGVLDFTAARACEIRVWAMFRQVSDEMEQYKDYAFGHNLKNRMPLWIKPNRAVKLQDVMHFMRDHLEGTELDMSKDVGAGPFACPYRWRPMSFEVDGQKYVNERTTATQQTGFSFVAQARSWLPDGIGGIIWFGVDDTASTVYAPMYTCMTEIPESYRVGNGAMMKWSENAAFWVFNQVTNFAYTKYSYIHPEIEKKQKEFEDKFVAYTPAIDQAALVLSKTNPEYLVRFLTDYSCKTANTLVQDWKLFYQYLFMKYMDGNIKTYIPGKLNPKVVQPGYGKAWERRVAESTGDKLKVKE